MLEAVFVLGALVLVGVLVAIASALTPPLMTLIGLWGLLLGLAAGVPTGLWYHVALYRALTPRMPLPRRWWLSPTELHPHVGEAEMKRIRPWFVIGGVGFIVSLIGGLAAMTGLLLGG